MFIRLLVILLSSCLSLAASDRVQLTLDTSEAEQVLAFLSLRSQGKTVSDSEWQELFATAPYDGSYFFIRASAATLAVLGVGMGAGLGFSVTRLWRKAVSAD